MRFFRLASAIVAAGALVAVTSCKTTDSTGLGAITCTDSPVCPPSTVAAGYNGTTGSPTITPTSSNTSFSTSSSSFTATGSTSGTLNGYWLLVQNGTVRAWGVLAVSGGFFAGDIPLFCGDQRVVYAFTNASGTAYYLVNVTLTGCSGASQFRVQLSWVSDPTSDLDLHLIRPAGVFASGNDCYYANCQGTGLDWGVTGAAGNPVLDVDDTEGFGPENIYLASGAETGQYRVVIHDFDGTIGEIATVRIYFGDVEAAKYTSLAMNASDHRYWEVAQVNVLTHVITTVNTYGSSAPATAGAAPAAVPLVK